MAAKQQLFVPGTKTWRQQYNPLRSLTITRVASLLELGEQGYYSDLTWLYRFIEKRDATLRALVSRRTSALKKLDWEIAIKEKEVEAAGKTAVAEKQREMLREVYQGIDNMKQAVEWLGMATFRGFSHLEKHFDNDWQVIHLEPVPQWYWCRKWPSADWLFNPTASMSNIGTPIEPDNFIIREIDAPVDEIAVVEFMRLNMSKKDWDGFIETFGIPPLFIEMPEDTSQTQQAAYQTICEEIIADGRGTLPAGAKVQPVVVGDRGRSPFKEHVMDAREQIVLAGTGGKLTMLNDPTGLGSGQSEVHAQTFDEIAAAEGEDISEMFQRHFDKPLLQEKFPAEEEWAYFALQSRPQQDVDSTVSQVQGLKTAGYKVQREQVEEKTGFVLEEIAEPPPFGGMSAAGFGEAGVPGNEALLQQRRRVKNRKPEDEAKLQKTAIDAIAEAQARDLAYVRNKLEKIMEIEDETIRNAKLKDFRASLPAVLRDMNKHPEMAEPLRNALSAAFFQGVELMEA